MLLRGCLVVELNLLNRIFLFGNFQSFDSLSAFSLARFGFEVFPLALAFWAVSWSASDVTVFRLPLPVFGVP